VAAAIGPNRLTLTHKEWNSVLEHPRLVGPWTPALEALVRQYLDEGRPFTVVLP